MGVAILGRRRAFVSPEIMRGEQINGNEATSLPVVIVVRGDPAAPIG